MLRQVTPLLLVSSWQCRLLTSSASLRMRVAAGGLIGCSAPCLAASLAIVLCACLRQGSHNLNQLNAILSCDARVCSVQTFSSIGMLSLSSSSTLKPGRYRCSVCVVFWLLFAGALMIWFAPSVRAAEPPSLPSAACLPLSSSEPL